MKWLLIITAAIAAFFLFCKQKKNKKPAGIIIGELDQGAYGEADRMSGSLNDVWAE